MSSSDALMACGEVFQGGTACRCSEFDDLLVPTVITRKGPTVEWDKPTRFLSVTSLRRKDAGFSRAHPGWGLVKSIDQIQRAFVLTLRVLASPVFFSR